MIQLLLPTTFPAGTTSQDASTALSETRRELTEKFDGLTAYVRSPARGTWSAPDGHVEQDDVVMVEVVTDRFDRAWWRSYATQLAARFRQESIHVRAVPVEMLDEKFPGAAAKGQGLKASSDGACDGGKKEFAS